MSGREWWQNVLPMWTIFAGLREGIFGGGALAFSTLVVNDLSNPPSLVL
jgi:hypothetical protein